VDSAFDPELCGEGAKDLVSGRLLSLYSRPVAGSRSQPASVSFIGRGLGP
jgi:hypothetical protein